jgi:hypothetical protein
MKRKQMIFSVLIFVGISMYAQVDENGNLLESKINERHSLKSTESIVEIPNIDFQFDSIRALTEINLPDNAEAYPWISNDGLRLYFTLETDSVDIVVMSDREHYDSAFETLQILSINSSLNDNSSPWLTDDELDIYFIIDELRNSLTSMLYHAHRNSMKDKFEEPDQVNLVGNISGYLRSPSFTMDMEKLYIYNSNSGIENILILDKVAVDEYQLVDTLNIPDGYESGPGKIGQDDLKYYISLTDIYENNALYVYCRESIEDSFDSVYYLNNEIINDSEFRNHQPSISKDGNYFVFVRSSENSWSSNDLYIAYNKSTPAGLVNIQNTDNAISIYPNPAVDYLTFDFLNSDIEEFTISIFTINGIHTESIMFTNNVHKAVISTAKYNSGVYLYKITSSDLNVGNGKFVVENY